MYGPLKPGELDRARDWAVTRIFVRKDTGQRHRFPSLRRRRGETLVVPIEDVAGAIKARRICDQAHLQFKEKLGLDHFEGCCWTGPRHALMTINANFSCKRAGAFSHASARNQVSSARKKGNPCTCAAMP